jgi:hypothetical protein
MNRNEADDIDTKFSNELKLAIADTIMFKMRVAKRNDCTDEAICAMNNLIAVMLLQDTNEQTIWIAAERLNRFCMELHKELGGDDE